MSLWPFALKAATRIMSLYFLDENVASPIEKMSSVERSYIRLKNEHPLFCTVYVLDRKNRSGLDTPKWEPKSTVGIYCGHSPEHSSDVALVMNLQTGYVTPQFHVTFDDGFTTVLYLDNEEAPPIWTHLFHYHTENYDANDFENITSSEGDNIPSSDTSLPEGDDHPDPVQLLHIR